MIDPTKLTVDDIGRTVMFRGKDRGTIFSFSRTNIEVIYPPSTSTVLSRPEDLDFLEGPGNKNRGVEQSGSSSGS